MRGFVQIVVRNGADFKGHSGTLSYSLFVRLLLIFGCEYIPKLRVRLYSSLLEALNCPVLLYHVA
jgi:hypothetical protein